MGRAIYGGATYNSVPYRMEIPKGGCLRPAADPAQRPAPNLQMGAAFSGGELPRNLEYVSKLGAVAHEHWGILLPR